MANDDVFGPLVDASVLERAVLAHLEKWLHTFLGRIEQVAPGVSYGEIGRPQTWQPDVDLRVLAEEAFPVVKVAVGQGQPYRDAEFLHMAWPVAVGVIVKAAEAVYARQAAHWYSWAVLGSMLHKSSLGGVISGLEFNGPQAIQELRGNAQKTYAMVPMDFTATVAEVLNLTAGPTVPDPLPDPTPGEEPTYPPVPTAETVQITTTHLDEEQ